MHPFDFQIGQAWFDLHLDQSNFGQRGVFFHQARTDAWVRAI